MELIKYTHSFTIVTQSGQVDSNCNSILFINIGADTCTVMGYPLLQSQQISFDGAVGELCITNFSVSFANVSNDKRLLVIKKNY